jgi:pyruvate ferredoxin oxidoreductase gamma subunit
MFQIRVRGHDGREVLTTAELLAAAAVAEGRRAVASVVSAAGTAAPSATSLCIIDGPAAIAVGEPAGAMADALIVLDPGGLGRAGVFAHLLPEAYLLVNSTCGFGDLGVGRAVERFCRDRTLIVPAERLDLGLPDGRVLSAIMAGGFAALSRAVGLDGVVRAIRSRMAGSTAWASEETAAAAYEFVRAEKEALAA